ncbi:ABC transporter substrate-binding protein [Mongoliitalea daihaiensis]|uniref:ABC transporter substrate-binding protein n=1 Tax=Mongoliitalea daihaiensis TaxID=2782006 RepID=UPI001F30600B|nr:ABC transporter substrate-binding protein [Mongoliitalea daihaiensis]UJP64703.1 amino acid ABC transporter substrate-binding protein [Mongoliitalea daihaiensis]
MKAILALFFSLTLSLSLFAQDKLANYKRGKTLISYGNYEEAMDALRPFLDEKEYGNLSTYATYHVAFAAYQRGQFSLAEELLSSLLNRGIIDQKEEAQYLLALTYFKQGQKSSALKTITGIKDPILFKEAENASFEFLKDTELDFLKENATMASANQGFNLAYLQQLQSKQRLSSEERTILTQLKEKVEIETSSFSTSKNTNYLDVAVILPFNQSGSRDVRELNSSNFIFELYQGLNFASEELLKQRVQLRIKTYDTERNTTKLQQILADPFVINSDIIVGPIYPEEVEIVAMFSERYNIPFINPLSNVDDRIKDLDYAYLFRPSIEQLSKGITAFAKNNIYGKKIAIGYSTASRDELLIKELENDLRKDGYSIIRSQKITGREVVSFFEGLGIRTDSTTRADLVILLSDDPNTANSAVGFMESKNIHTPVLVMDSWLYFNFANYEMLENQNFHFVANNLLKLNSQPYERFREDFLGKNMMYPSLNVSLGYELMYFIYSTFEQSHKRDWRDGLNRSGFREGKISQGFNFTQSQSNTFVPVYRLENGILELK